MVFKGFEQKFPEYEVITPQTKFQYTVRSITTAEELKIKTSLVGKQNFTNLLNETLFSCIVRKPDHIKTYEDFCKNTTLNDRDAIFIGWYHCSYGNIIDDIPVMCPYCENQFTIKYDLSKGGHLEEYPGKPGEILKKEVKVNLEYAPATVLIESPTVQKEINSLKDAWLQNQNEDIINYYMMIRQLSYYEAEDTDRNNPIPLKNTTDIIYALNSLIPKDKKKLKVAYAENFGKYNLSLPYEVACTNQNCNKPIAGEVDLFRYFFREIYEG